MTKQLEFSLSPEEAYNESIFAEVLKQKTQTHDGDLIVHPLRRSIDARGRKVIVRVLVELLPRESLPPKTNFIDRYQSVSNGPRVLIVGAGPAGLFAALRLIEQGLKPIIIERGKDVRSRRRDIAAVNKIHVVNPESNYCFGEGGAGTYSDGKLYTRSNKRGNVRRILKVLVAHGATDQILFDAHPHIGTNKLPGVVNAIRDTIIAAGGEILFNTRVDDILIERDLACGVITSAGDRITGEAVILATGHSARDIYELLHRKNIFIEAKPFALGVRVEHSQQLIDRLQYHCDIRDPYLPASSYSLVHQAKVDQGEIGVFSFCMCPGGFIVPSATSPGEVVVNGMSPSRRDSKFANSGIVVAVDLSRFAKFKQHGPLAGMYFQKEIEQTACSVAGNTQRAPAQRLIDFVERCHSANLLETSYQPGLTSIEMRDVLPPFITDALVQGFRNFGSKMKGYLTNEAQVIGVESRTSSPVRIPRDKDTWQHVQVKRLYPCGEGAGYAGGIVSAAMDGERCAEAIGKTIQRKI